MSYAIANEGIAKVDTSGACMRVGAAQSDTLTLKAKKDRRALRQYNLTAVQR